jgi:hypothetical protein
MDSQKNIDLASIFRACDAKLGLDGIDPKEGLLEKKLTKLESGANTFLLDKKYALRLDELI